MRLFIVAELMILLFGVSISWTSEFSKYLSYCLYEWFCANIINIKHLFRVTFMSISNICLYVKKKFYHQHSSVKH